MNSHKVNQVRLLLLLVAVVCWNPAAGAERPGWERQPVNWYLPGGTRVKAVKHPKEKPPLFLKKHRKRKLAARRKKILPAKKSFPSALAEQKSATPIFTSIIDSPPIDGFIPWIVVTVTDKRSEELDLVSVQTTSIDGNSPPGYNPQSDYVIGIFDTGASAHVMGNAAAIQSGLFNGSPNLVSNNIIKIAGVIGSADTWVSQPLGIYMDGLDAISPGGLLTDTSGMVGQTNVSILVGQGGPVDLPTVIGTPMAVYYTAVFHNDQQIILTHNTEHYITPAITFHEHGDAAIPSYSKIIPLELRPLGGLNVQYIPDFDIFGDLLDLNFDFDFSTPQVPSTIVGNLSQSVFFVHSVDIGEGGHIAFDKNRFMLDTGAQVTVIGSRIGARLGLNPAAAEFQVEIQGVTGESEMKPGFYIDLLQIPALGEWFSFTNVPVILLDIFSPEGGTLDGIIGMNLFVDFNFVLRGGGLFLQDDPRIELEPLGERMIADIGPPSGDGIVDSLDLAAFVEAWLTTPASGNWNPKCDMAPLSGPDGRVDLLDFAVLAEYWLQTAPL
ncbi:MAG: aspartyl protease family protein [Planctomycetota bacterium]|jgi:hypothetical protein